MRFSIRVIIMLIAYSCMSSATYAQYDQSTAVSLPLNGSSSGSMSSSYDDNWWKITTTADGSLYINTLASSGLEIDNYIYDQNGITQIAGYDYSGSHPEDQTHVNNLAAGTYFIRSHRYSGTGTYTITSHFTATRFVNDAEPDDSASVALTLPLNISMTGHLRFFGNGKTDYEDWYRITTTADGALYINTLSDSTLEIDNYIYDKVGNPPIASFDFGGRNVSDQAHISNLAAGTYYIRTTGYDGYGSYTITSNFTPSRLQNDTEPNDSSKVALILPLNSSATGHLGYYGFGKTDIDDWWKITTTVDGIFYINTLSDEDLEIDNYIYDNVGNPPIASFDFGGRSVSDQVHISNLGPGTYFVRTNRYAGYGSYTIKCSFTPTRFTSDQEPNSTLAAATGIPVGSTRYGHLGFYSSGVTDTEDFYSFSVPAGWDSLFVRVLSDSTLDVDANLYNSAGNWILHDGASGINTVMVLPKPIAGQYFLNIYRYSGSGAYAFIISNTRPASVNIPIAVDNKAPLSFKVSDPYPNPFNPTVTIRYQLPESAHVRLTVFDILGRMVAVPEEGLKSAGVHETVWNARNGNGTSPGSGIYFWRLEAGSHSAQGKMMLLR